MQSFIKKILVFCALVIFNGFMWFYFDLGALLTFDTIKNNRTLLLATVNNNYWLSVGIYIIAYMIDAALFLPATAIMIMVGGFLFGIIPTVFFGIIGATTGATIAFLITRYSFWSNHAAVLWGKTHRIQCKIQLNNLCAICFLSDLFQYFHFF